MTEDHRREAELDEVRRIVRKWGRAFTNRDPQLVVDMWDQTYEHLVYQGEDFAGPLLGWDEIHAYLMKMLQVDFEIRDQAMTEMYSDILGETAWVYFRGWSTGSIPGGEIRLTGATASATDIRGETRHTFLLRRRGGAWRIIHYHESRVIDYMAECDSHLIPVSAKSRAAEQAAVGERRR